MGLLSAIVRDGVWTAAFSLAFILLAVASFCIRRIYFHPLSKYPGPLLAKITDFYAGYHAWKGDIHVDMWRCHEKYGPYVRYSPNKLNINNIAALRDIYVGNKNFQKSPNYRVLRHQAANTLTMVNKKEHARRRRIVSQGVSDAAMRNHELTVLAHIEKCFATITKRDLYLDKPEADHHDSRWTAAQNMSNWFNWLTFDIMGDVIFGVRYNLLGSSQKRGIVTAIENSNVRVSVLLQSPVIRLFGRVDRWMFPKAIQARNVFLRFVAGLVEQCMKPENTSKGATVVSVLKSSSDPITGDKLTAKEIMAESTTLCVAGADTSSTALAATFFYLARNPLAYKKAAREVRLAFTSTDQIRLGSELNSLTYVRACIDEALRMSPPAGSSLYREVQSGGATVDGHHFSQGTEIGVPIYGIHHNPEYFPSPFSYLPERWIVADDDTSRANVELARAAFCPFSLGTRSCIGKGMAMVELMLTVAYALFTLDFKLADFDVSGGRVGAEKGWDVPGEFKLVDHITASKNGPMLLFRTRDVLITPVTPVQPGLQPHKPQVMTNLRPEFRQCSASSPSMDFSAMWKNGLI
ncbi:hypothetical protein GJ744_001947 [Endocarpon pusillum]|uniref:Isotrichodermin C-15 hydroxylase n=1 Tax=Endocarpon pusillum TaxID=364733 RepID=A0A8H7E6M3_9EURO|nr:hypothetical protein GJ744_001947 [Endocarpon pusillum]